MANLRKVKISAAIVMAAGIMVMSGWFFDIGALKSILPGWVTMKFATALCFFLSGILLWCMARPPEAAAEIYETVIGLNSLLILLVMSGKLVFDLSGLSGGLESLFVKEGANAVQTFIPGMPSLFTILAFFLIVAAGISAVVDFKKPIVWAGSAIGAVGAAAVLGYIFKAPLFYGTIPGHSSAMALHTACLFVIVGASFVLLHTPLKAPGTPSETPAPAAPGAPLSRWINILLLLPLAAAIIAISFFASFLHATKCDISHVNAAGRQRMLSAEMLSWVNMVAGGQDEDRQGLRLRVADFGAALNALQNGGVVHGDVLDPAPAEIRPSLAAVADLWRDLRPDLDIVANARRPAPGKSLESRFLDLRDRSDRVVTAFAGRSRRLQMRLINIMTGIAGFMGLFFVAGRILAGRYIVRPTERLLLALDLRRKHAETIIASMPAGLLVLNGDLTVIKTNRVFLETQGLDESAAVGHPLEEVLPAAGLREAALQVLETGRARKGLRFEAAEKNGIPKLLRVAITETYLVEGEGEGEEARLLLILEDISREERLKEHAVFMESEHNRKEAEYRTIIQTSLDGFCSTDLSGRILDVNEAYCRMLGYTREEFLRLKVGDFEASESPEETAAHFQKFVRTGSDLFQTRQRRKDGTVLDVETSVQYIAALGERIFSFTRDITGQKSAEAEKLLAEEKLRQSQKMEVVGRLAGGVAHDFNNVLTAILGYSDMILKSLKSDDPNKADVLEIMTAGARAAALTKQLLAFSRKQVLTPQRLDVNIVVTEIRGMLRRLIGEDCEFSILHGEGPMTVEADRGQLEQIIMNLVLNAKDAMPGGGKIIVETAPAELEEAYAHRYGNISAGSYATLAVSDTGCGMSEAVLAHLFEPFFTTKEKGKGTGLGLATVCGIAAQSGGYITVCSQEGRGSTFRLYLPRAGAVAGKAEPAAGPGELPQGSGVVLLVEDEAPVRTLARRMLISNGFTVIETGDPLEALAICERHKEPIRLLVTDMVMPKMDGLELAGKVRAARPGIRVLYMSGYTEHVVLERGGEALRGALLLKPFVSRVFLKKVHEILGAGQQ